MTDHPILFSAPMVRALLDGSKTQTRRIIKDRGAQPEFCGGRYDDQNDPSCWGFQDYERGKWITLDQWQHWRLVPHRVGDRLWVRENFQAHSWAADCVTIRYAAEAKTKGFTAQIEQIPYPAGDRNAFKYIAPKGPDIWRPSIHMPRWASRLTLVVTDVRVQRLQEISWDDAIAEGLLCKRMIESRSVFGGRTKETRREHLRTARIALENTLDGLDASDQNPWVVATTFTTHHCNIDKMGEAQ